MRPILTTVLLAAGLVAGGAHATTPSLGHWYNTAEGGTGMNIDMQDDLMYVTVYAYDANGFPEWYTSLDEVEEDGLGRLVFDGRLNLFEDGACVGCAYSPATFLGTVGNLRIVFDPNEETRATMTWGLDGGPARSVTITHTPFGLKRPSDPASVPVHVTKMLGEWSVVQDFSDTSATFPYYGDMLVFDQFSFDAGSNRWFFDGCRAESMFAGECTPEALDQHDASGFYDTSVGRQVIVVTDTRDGAGNPVDCLLYDVDTDIADFEGGIDGNGGGLTVYTCGTNPFDNEFVPVRGFRSASRTFVETGVGPSKATAAAKAGSTAGADGPSRPLLPKAATPDQTRAETLRIVRALEARLGVR